MTVAALVLCAIATGPQAAAAATLRVCPVGCTFSAIQPAIDAAQVDDVVEVAPASYVGPVVVDKAITVTRPRADPVTVNPDNPRFTIAGEGSGPTLTVGSGAKVIGVVVEASGSPAHPGVRVVGSSGFTDDPSGSLEYAIVRGSEVGLRVEPDGRADLRSSRIEAAARVGVEVARSGPSGGSLRASHVTIDGSAVGIDTRGSGLVVEWSTITVPAGGTGLRLSDTTDTATVTSSTVRGDGRPGTTGIEVANSIVNGARIDDNRFELLTTSVRIADSSSDRSGHRIADNLFAVSADTAPVVWESPGGGEVTRNFVACPHVTCPTVAGVHASVPIVHPVALRLHSAGMESGTTDADSDLTISASLGLEGVDYAVSQRDFASTAYGGTASFDFSETPGRIADRYAPEGSVVVRTGAAGTTLDVVARYLGRPVRASLRLVGAAPRATTLPRTTGLRRMGNSIRCEGGRWPIEPTSVSYRWRAGRRTVDGPVLQLTRDDVLRGSVTCEAVARFAAHRQAVASRRVTVFSEPLGLQQIPLDERWRAMRCGARLAAPCRVTRRIGVRFSAASASRRRVQATIALQRRVRGRWVPWVRGTVPLPLRGGVYLPGRLVQPGTYRLQLSVPSHDVYRAERSAWRWWVVR